MFEEEDRHNTEQGYVKYTSKYRNYCSANPLVLIVGDFPPYIMAVDHNDGKSVLCSLSVAYAIWLVKRKRILDERTHLRSEKPDRKLTS